MLAASVADKSSSSGSSGSGSSGGGGPPRPPARYYFGFCHLGNGTIAISCGFTGSSLLSDVWVTHDGCHTWERTSSGKIPARRLHCMAADDDGNVLITSGSNGGELRDVWVGRMARDFERVNSHTPFSSRTGARMVHFKKAFYFMGGNYPVMHNDVWRSADLGKSWVQLSNATWSPRAYFSLVATPSSIVVLGGMPERLGAWITTDGVSWIQSNDMPQPRAGHGAALSRSGSIIVTGAYSALASRDVWECSSRFQPDSSTMAWSLVTKTPCWRPRRNHGMVAVHDALFVMFGDGGQGVGALDDCFVSCDNGRTWHDCSAESSAQIRLEATSAQRSEFAALHPSSAKSPPAAEPRESRSLFDTLFRPMSSEFPSLSSNGLEIRPPGASAGASPWTSTKPSSVSSPPTAATSTSTRAHSESKPVEQPHPDLASLRAEMSALGDKCRAQESAIASLTSEIAKQQRRVSELEAQAKTAQDAAAAAQQELRAQIKAVQDAAKLAQQELRAQVSALQDRAAALQQQIESAPRLPAAASSLDVALPPAPALAEHLQQYDKSSVEHAAAQAALLPTVSSIQCLSHIESIALGSAFRCTLPNHAVAFFKMPATSLPPAVAQRRLEAEHEICSRIPPHPNVAHVAWFLQESLTPDLIRAMPPPLHAQLAWAHRRGQRLVSLGVTHAAEKTLEHLVLVPSISPNELLGIWLQLLDIQIHLEAAGVLHLDFQPANLVICGLSGKVVLANFGFAVHAADGQVDARKVDLNSLCQERFAPEVARAVGSRETLLGMRGQRAWETGIVMYEVATGQIPGQPLDMSLGAVLPQLPRSCLAVLSGLLNADPAARMPVAQARHDLIRAIGDIPDVFANVARGGSGTQCALLRATNLMQAAILFCASIFRSS